MFLSKVKSKKYGSGVQDRVCSYLNTVQADF